MDKIAVTGVNHQNASLQVREKLSFTNSQQRQALQHLHHKLQEVVLLFTCNRMEIYTVSDETSTAQETLVEFLSQTREVAPSKVRKLLFHYTGEDAVQHLFKVVCGLDSMVLGETQVLGQVKEAYGKACEQGTVSKVFHTLFQQAFKTGKRVQGETGINDHSASVSYVAIKLAREKVGCLKDKTVLVVGAGEMSELTLKHLVEDGANSVLVVNRTRERARELAGRFKGSVLDYNLLHHGLREADIIITSTGAPHHVIRLPVIEKALADIPDKKLFFIDIAVPRDVDPEVSRLKGVHLYDIHDLQEVVSTNWKARREDAHKAVRIVKEEANRFMEWYSLAMVEPCIAALRRKGESIYRKEREEALARLSHLSSKERKIVDAMGRRIMNQLVKDPVMLLKEMARKGQGDEASRYLYRAFRLEEFFKEASNHKQFKGGPSP